jgi:hypothetical protein
MSMRLTPAAQLSNYNGPFYPTMTVEVGNAFVERDKAGMAPAQVEGAARRCQGFHGIRFNVATSDGYRWYAIATFNTGNGRVAIAIPFAGDANYTHNTPLDRSPAAYLQGLASVQDAGQVAASFARAMRA